MSNPFTALQDRVAAILAPEFADDTILTEALGDLVQRVDRVVMELGFGLVVTTARGSALEEGEAPRELAGPLGLREELTVAIVHNPLLQPDRVVLEALWTVVRALHGQPITSPATAHTPVLRVTGHEVRDDAPDGVVVHHVHLATNFFPNP